MLLTQLSSAVNAQFDIDKQQFGTLFDEIQAFRSTTNHLEHFLSMTRSIFQDLANFVSFNNQLSNKITLFLCIKPFLMAISVCYVKTMHLFVETRP